MDAVVKIFTGLGVDSSILQMFIIFVGSYFVMRFLFIGRLSDFLVEREHRVDGRVEKANGLKEEFSKIQSTLKEQLQKAQREAADIFQSVRLRAQDEQRKIIQAARDEAAAEIQTARTKATDALNVELKKIEGEIPQLAKLIVDRIGGSGAASRSSTLSSGLSGK